MSSVTASVGKQIGAIGAMSGIDIGAGVKSEENKTLQHPTVLHKKLYDRNYSLHQRINQYFEVRLSSSISRLSPN